MFMKALEQEMILVVLFCLGIIALVFKKNQVMNEIYNLLSILPLSKRTILYTVSLCSGVLPIPGRTAVSNVVLDTLQDPKHNNEKWGVLSYLATHHYYLWSPIEKSVLISMSVLGLTYSQFLAYTIPVLIVYQVFTLVYILTFIKNDDIYFNATTSKINWVKLLDAGLFVVAIILAVFEIVKLEYSVSALALYYAVRYNVSFKQIMSETNWKLLLFVGIVVIAGVYVQEYEKLFSGYIKHLQENQTSIVLLLSLCMAFSITMGSSAKFAALAALMTSVFGMQYFMLFYIVDYCGYLLAPTHKCVAMAKEYYNTRFSEFYGVMALLCLVLIGQSLIRFFI